MRDLKNYSLVKGFPFLPHPVNLAISSLTSFHPFFKDIHKYRHPFYKREVVLF